MAKFCVYIGYIILLASVGLSLPTNETVNCAEHYECQSCMDVGCLWGICLTEGSCQDMDTEFCTPQDCFDNSTTTAAPTEAPTTLIPTDPPTTLPPPTEAPTDPPTTQPPPTTAVPTEPPITPAPTQPPTEAPTTAGPTVPPTEAPTDAPTTTPTTTATPPAPEPRHFDPASFIGGMVFAAAIVAVMYAAWRFWQHRNDRNYHTL